MNYVYPKFSKHDLCVFRLGGAGLGNLLFIYARALVFAKKNQFDFIWPTWLSFKIGPYIRCEKDKRLYNDLFSNNSGYVQSLNKLFKLVFYKKIKEEHFNTNLPYDNTIIVFDKYIMDFEPLLKYRNIIRKDLIRNLKKENLKALKYEFSNSISVHVRLGDFSVSSEKDLSAGKDNSRLPIMWYVDVINMIRKILGYNIKVYVFSDGRDDELKPITKLGNVERITFGNSISDIFALSQTKLLIASGSTFSMWARFLGETNAISFENQLKCKGLCGIDGFEEEIGNNVELSNDIAEKIRKLYS